MTNPDKPNANDLILSEMIAGSPGKGTSFWQIAAAGAGEHYFRGPYNSKVGVGALGAGNTLRWFVDTIYDPRQVLCLSASSAVSNGLLFIGTRDIDSDDIGEQSCISLYDSQGNLASELIYTSDSSEVRFHWVEELSDTMFLVAGTEQSNSGRYPLLATVSLTPAGSLEKRRQAAIGAMQDRYFNRISVDQSSLQVSEVSFFALVGVSSSDTVEGTEVQRVTVGLPSLSPCTVDWVSSLAAGSGARAEWVDMLVHSDAIYVVGNVEDAGKIPAPSGGGHWHSGLVVSLTLGGGLRWETDVSLTKHDEKFNDLVATPEALYAVGKAAEFMDVDSGQRFGYGLISEIEPGDGTVSRSMTFGADTYLSSFNNAIVSGAIICCGGYTHQVVSGSFQGWYCEVDVSIDMAANQMPQSCDLPGSGGAKSLGTATSSMAPGPERDGF